MALKESPTVIFAKCTCYTQPTDFQSKKKNLLKNICMPHKCILSLFQCFLILYILFLCSVISHVCYDACTGMIINNGGLTGCFQEKIRESSWVKSHMLTTPLGSFTLTCFKKVMMSFKPMLQLQCTKVIKLPFASFLSFQTEFNGWMCVFVHH